MSEQLASSMKKVFEVVLPLAVVAVTLASGYIVRKIAFERLAKWSKNTASRVGDIIISVIKGPFIIWVLMLGIYFALEVSTLPERVVRVANQALLVLGVFSVTLVLANLATRLIKIHSSRLETAMPVTSLTQNIARITVFGI
ncbi:MAG: hypothetical protein NTX52_06125, partial [Planctomycetota bacterium]|nr:hypothetical protein [Planctomycetota bacterium]